MRRILTFDYIELTENEMIEIRKGDVFFDLWDIFISCEIWSWTWFFNQLGIFK